MKNPKIKLVHVLIFLCCLIMLLFEVIPNWKSLSITSDKVYNRLISQCIPMIAGGIAVTLISRGLGLRLFAKPYCLWALLPAVIIALDNFPWLAYFAGKMTLIYTQPLHFLLFALYCILVGLFEEILFRGIFFALFAAFFEKSHKGLLYTYVVSSLVFGGVHLFNVFYAGGGAVLQAGYSVLTGGLFAFVFIKTKNILFSAVIHALYNFCGTLFTSELGLGLGSIIDAPTAIMMTVISVIIGSYVLYSVWKTSEIERNTLYKRLGVK